VADGLAYLCKEIQKCSNAKCGYRMRELAETIAHGTLRKYAGLAARELKIIRMKRACLNNQTDSYDKYFL
jgi:hypothetical protein